MIARSPWPGSRRSPFPLVGDHPELGAGDGHVARGPPGGRPQVDARHAGLLTADNAADTRSAETPLTRASNATCAEPGGLLRTPQTAVASAIRGAQPPRQMLPPKPEREHVRAGDPHRHAIGATMTTRSHVSTIGPTTRPADVG